MSNGHQTSCFLQLCPVLSLNTHLGCCKWVTRKKMQTSSVRENNIHEPLTTLISVCTRIGVKCAHRMASHHVTSHNSKADCTLWVHILTAVTMCNQQQGSKLLLSECALWSLPFPLTLKCPQSFWHMFWNSFTNLTLSSLVNTSNDRGWFALHGTCSNLALINFSSDKCIGSLVIIRKVDGHFQPSFLHWLSPHWQLEPWQSSSNCRSFVCADWILGFWSGSSKWMTWQVSPFWTAQVDCSFHLELFIEHPDHHGDKKMLSSPSSVPHESRLLIVISVASRLQTPFRSHDQNNSCRLQWSQCMQFFGAAALMDAWETQAIIFVQRWLPLCSQPLSSPHQPTNCCAG